jgi:integrase
MDMTTTTTIEQQTSAQPRKRHSRRARGVGGLYQRGETWWIRYSVNGRQQRESSGSTNVRVAEGLLRTRLEEAGKGGFVSPTAARRVTVGTLLDAITADYQLKGRRSADTLAGRLVHLREAFGDLRAVDVMAGRVRRYQQARVAASAAPATVNRECAALRRAFRIAVKDGTLNTMPSFDMLPERNVRQGFVEPAEFEQIVANLPERLQDYATFAYHSGWRKGEVATLAWGDVDRTNSRVVLRPEHSKNGRARVLPLVGTLADVIERRWKGREYQAVGGTAIARFVFHEGGHPIGDFRKSWASACIAAGRYRVVLVKDEQGEPIEQKIPTVIFHDLRRSAVMNLDRAGVSTSTAMQITGHMTDSIYRRYRIVPERDMAAALAKTQDSVKAAAANARQVVVPIRSASASG